MRISKMILNILVAIMIGIFTGVVAYTFNAIITGFVSLANLVLINNSIFYLIFPIIASIIAYFLYVLYLKDNDSGLGIVQVLVELERIQTFLMKPISVIVHVLGALTTLILGLSAGRFGPVVHLGSAIGSNIGYYFNSDEDRIRMYIGCSAAAAIAAVFNMPLFGAVFVLEVLYKKQFFDFFSPILISSLTANILSNLLGNNGIPRLDLVYVYEFSLSSLGVYLIFGLLIGLISIAYIESIERFTTLFNKYKKSGLRYFIGGITIGIIALIFPLNFEIHSNTTFNALIGNYGVKTLLLIASIKLISTGITLGSGFIGGNFYPGITVGASFGIAYGKILSNLTNNSISVPAFGALGIGGMIGGYFNAPISGIILALEYANSFSLVMPAIFVTAISVTTVYYLYGKDIFTKTYIKILSQLHG